MVNPSQALRGLYVEDNAQDADLTRRALRQATPSIELDVVRTVAQALAQLDASEGRHAWVLFDLNLPDGDGMQVLRHVRAMDLPMAAIAVTGTGDERAVAQALKMGVDDYVIKTGAYLADLPRVMLDARDRQLQARQRHRNIRILYVEDNLHDGDLTARHLASHAPHLSLEVLDAPFQLLQERLHRQDFDVLLLDYRLENLDAFEIIRRMRRGPDPHLPIVIITGHGAEDTAVQALRLGVSDYIVKDGKHLQRLPDVLESAFTRAQLLRERERLRMSEAQLQQLTRHVPGAFVVTRYAPSGKTQPVFATDALSTIQGLSLQDLSDGGLQERLHEQDRGKLRAAIDQAVLSMGMASCEYRLDCPPKGWRWFETQMTPERQSDGSVLVYCYTFDITERKQFAELQLEAEAARQANQAKTEFLSRMSHELRTPLNAVLGFAQLLQMEGEDVIRPAQRRQVGFIEQAGTHLLGMINEVLDLARIESGQLQLKPTAVDLGQCCLEALALVESAAREHQIQVHVEANALSSLPRVWADPLRLRQVLVNLLSNAIKYNRHGGQVTVRAQDQPGQVELSITDTGTGMSSEQLSHLFEPFNRLGAERTRIEGTGIGLVIARKLLELMGGRIQVESAIGQGSCFAITVPMARTPATEIAALVGLPSGLATPSVPSHRTVLYAEDDPVNIELMHHILEDRMGLNMMVATSGEQAIEMALRSPPDLLLLDMRMGDMDGVAISEALRHDPRLQSVPRIALSADASSFNIQRATAHGFADYLTKPVDLKAFMACLAQHLSSGKP